MTREHITVCICTFQRCALLVRLVKRLLEQDTQDLFSFDIVVVDNDRRRSAERVVAELNRRMNASVTYDCEPEQNIALARNRAMSRAMGTFIACIDDDEIPERDWLVRLYQTCRQFEADGALGPVEPSYAGDPPAWIVRGKFYDRPHHGTGDVLGWRNTRTGNVLFKRDLLGPPEEWFQPAFGSGGEDRDFFRRKIANGRRFVWCAEAPVWELVPPERCTRSFLVRRAFLRGQLPHFTKRDLLKSLIAVPLYSLVLPVLLFFGHHVFMQYLIRDCDHIGRIFAFLGRPLIKERYVVQ